MMRYKCSTCENTCEKFAEVIDHMIIKHPQDELRIKKLVENDQAKSILWQTNKFQAMPSAVKDNGCFIYSEPKTETIKIAKLATTYDFPELSGTNSFSENLIDTPDKKTRKLQRFKILIV